MVKIVFLTPILQPYRISFYDKLSKINKDHQLVVMYGIPDKEDGKTKYEGNTNFESLGFKEIKLKIGPYELISYKGMFEKFKSLNPDVLIVLATPGIITYRRIVAWARRKGKIIIFWTSGWEPGRAKGIMLALKNQFVSSFFKNADFFLTYSNYATRYVGSMGIDKSKIEICYNGIETDNMIDRSEDTIQRSLELIKRYDLENHITFLFVGGLIPEKRVDLLIEAFIELFKKYKNLKLLLIGDGPLRGQIEEMLNKYCNPNIIYLGRIIDGVDSYFAASDCLVLPGAGGLALNQAMFWKTPCIVSRADGTEDDLVIEDFTGYRFKENNLASLISAMERRIHTDHDKLNLISENSYNMILQKSNVNNMVKVFSKNIDLLISRNLKENSEKSKV
jgi:glycosyltransferase involved in cell wall biosynthesis